MNLKIPPLRERPQDVLALAEHFIDKYSQANGLPPRLLSAEGRRALSLNPLAGQCPRTGEHAASRGAAHQRPRNRPRRIDDAGWSACWTRAPQSAAASHAAAAAEQVTRAFVGRTVADVERDLILETLKHCLGNRTHAANILGISIHAPSNT